MQSVDASDFPDSLAVKIEEMPLLFPVHMVTGALSLLLVPLALALRRWRRWHVPVARIAAVDVIIAGVTAIPVALIAPVTPWSAAGFTAQACVWLALLANGIRHIRHGRVAQHRAAMLMMAATTSGAIFFRLYLMAWAMLADGRHFRLFYGLDAWLAWLLPLLATWSLLRAAQRAQSRAKIAR